MSEQTFYEILGVNKNATAEEIKRSYKDLAKKLHPDKNPDNREESEKKFKELSEAYQCLSDENKREIYDKHGKEGLQDRGMDFNEAQFEEMMNNMFGMGSFFFGQRNQNHYATELGKKLDITMEDIYNGNRLKVHLPGRLSLCKKCNGYGSANGKDYTCAQCQGMGMVSVLQRMGPGLIQTNQSCPKCRGKGVSKEFSKCKICDGSRTQLDPTTIEIDIPNYSMDGTKIKIPNMGHEYYGPNSVRMRSNVILIISELPHKVFKRTNTAKNDLSIEFDINLAEALCGLKRKIVHLDGRELWIEYNKIIDPTELMVVEGEGTFDKKNEKGNLIIKFNIKFPKEISVANKKKLMQIFSDNSQETKPTNAKSAKLKKYKMTKNSQFNNKVECNQQ